MKSKKGCCSTCQIHPRQVITHRNCTRGQLFISSELNQYLAELLGHFLHSACQWSILRMSLSKQGSAGFVPRRYITRPVPLALPFVAPTRHTLSQTSVFGASQLPPHWASSAVARHPSGTRREAFLPAPQIIPLDGLAQSFAAEEHFVLLPILTPFSLHACARPQRHPMSVFSTASTRAVPIKELNFCFDGPPQNTAL